MNGSGLVPDEGSSLLADRVRYLTMHASELELIDRQVRFVDGPGLVLGRMLNLATNVKEPARIGRIVRHRIRWLEWDARGAKYPDGADRKRRRAAAYRWWIGES